MEERTDVYQLHGVDGLGVKYRGRTILEVKRLVSVGDAIDLDVGLAAALTRWSKTRPLDEDAAWASRNVPNVNVRKRIVKRSFGREDSLQRGIAIPGARSTKGCNVEVTSVLIGDFESWSFAFEAFGPLLQRRSMINDAWVALISDARPPADFARYLGLAVDYATWLEAGSTIAPAASWGRSRPVARR